MPTTSSRSRPFNLRPLIALVLIVGILYVAKTVIVPLALAILLTFILAPVVSTLQHRGLGRVPAVIVTALLAFFLFGVVGFIVGIQINDLATELPAHRKEIDAKIAGLRGDGQGPIPKLLQMIRELGRGETQAVAAADATAPKEKVVVLPPESSGFEQLANNAGPILEPVAQAGLIFVLVIFMLIQREDLRNRIIGLLGHGDLTGTTRVLVDSAQRVSRLLLTQLLVNLGFGVLFAFGLFFAGVPYAFLWGFLAFIFRFVPYIGSLAAVVCPFVLAFAVAPGWTQPVVVLALFGVLELVTGNIVEPLLFGHGTGVSPIALLIAAAFWMWIWGPIGLLLSTPLTVCLVVLGQHIPRLRFLALLLGNKAALDSHTSYYQRLLARDKREAEQVVVEHARANGQEKVYDEVLLPALARTCRDRKHAGLDSEDEAFIFQTTRDILESSPALLPVAPGSPPLADAGTEEVAPVPGGVMILGCPAHHEAEELTIAMLGHLLKQDALKVDVLSTRALPSESESRIEKDGPALVFISIMPPGGVVQARYLCKRLRKRFPALPIVVGFWGSERHYDKLLERLLAAGASYVTTSLLQTRSQILAILSNARKITPAAVAHMPCPGLDHAAIFSTGRK